MRLGGPVEGPSADPHEWVSMHVQSGYGAAFAPPVDPTDAAAVRTWTRAAAAADLTIAEVGAWSNPLSPDDKVRAEAIAFCRERLALAEELGARCCVNLAGSRGEVWDGPHPDNFTKETFTLLVDTIRAVIDAVRPTRTFYTLETMPWMLPDSTDEYLRLLRAVDRPRFAVHFDPVNLVNSPRRYYATGALIREFVHKLGPWIRSCHAKDIILSPRLTTHLEETRPGAGRLDYGVYLTAVHALDPDMPVMLEHLSGADAYRKAADHLRRIAEQNKVPLTLAHTP